MTKLPKVCYIRWLDAVVSSDSTVEVEKSDCELIELHSLGWLESRSKKSIRIGLEHCEGRDTSRVWLIVPRSCIQEVRLFDLPPAKNRK